MGRGWTLSRPEAVSSSSPLSNFEANTLTSHTPLGLTHYQSSITRQRPCCTHHSVVPTLPHSFLLQCRVTIVCSCHPHHNTMGHSAVPTYQDSPVFTDRIELACRTTLPAQVTSMGIVVPIFSLSFFSMLTLLQ
jgi:hypothetical protein